MPKKKATQTQGHSITGRNHRWRRGKSEGGAIAIMAAVMIVIMIAMFGFVLDLSRSFNRKTELQSIADAAALAAANALDGTQAGIDNAVSAAAATAANFSYSYNSAIISWSPSALTFGTAPDGGSEGWVDGNAAKPNAGKVFFARVNTSVLDSSHGRVENILMPVLSASMTETNVAAVAVAGRDSLNALPLAICAISNTPAAPLPPNSPSAELVEYGFRRGISYDLMNPGGGSAKNYLINPIAPAGTVGDSMMGNLDIVKTYVCTGTMAIPALQGGNVTVEQGFPIGQLYKQLNSRFGTYDGSCHSSSAPADPNTTSFDLASANWIISQPSGLSVGPLWSYAKAVKYASYDNAKGIEPAAGYSTFLTSDWGTLYPGTPAAKAKSSYPPTTPYQTTGGASAYKTLYNTRVLRVPLLECPLSSGATTAKVLGVGKFFMIVQADASTLFAEFAGVEPWTAIVGKARIYR